MWHNILDRKSKRKHISFEAINMMKIPLLLVFIHSLYVVYSFENLCPSIEDMQPCHCVSDGKNIRVDCLSVTSVEDVRKALQSTKGIQRVFIDFIMARFDKVPSDLFKGLHVTKISFTNCNFKKFGDEGRSALEGLEDTIEEFAIHFSFSEENELKYLNVSSLRVIEDLEIEGNELTKMGNEWFRDGPRSVKNLFIMTNFIEELGDKAFENLVNLKNLWLTGNKFEVMKRSMLPSPATYLVSLDLTDNRISSLPEDMFTNMPSLKEVILADNSITRIPEATWSSIWTQITRLYLEQHLTMRILSSVLFFLGLVAASANAETCPLPEEIAPCHCYESTGDIVVLCIDEPNTLAELKTALNSLSQKNDVLLELENLKLGRIPSDFFYGIGVTSLTITDCELDSLQGEDGRASLLGLEDSLENLSILSSFTEDNVFAKLKLGHLRKLKDLHISGNTITELKDDWFDRGLVTLETLYISDNGIEKVGDRAFANLINLEQLSFEGNRFGSLKRSMLPSAAHKLNILTLENNDLASIPEDTFSGMSSLKEVSLCLNRIARLEQRTWQPVWQQLEYINLRGNPLECDSHMKWMFDLRMPAYIIGQCEAPSDRKGLSLQDFIDRRG